MRRLRNRASGFSMVEVAISVTVLMIAVAGTLSFNKHTVRDVYRSRVKTDATMFGTMVMEAWRGQGGTTAFDPVLHLSSAILNCSDVTITYAWIGPSIPPGFYYANVAKPFYKITANGIDYRLSLSYHYIDGRKYLNVRILYPNSLDISYIYSNDYIGVTQSIN